MALTYKSRAARAGREVRGRSLPPGGRVRAQGPGVVGFARGQAVPPLHRGGRGVGDGSGGPAHGVRQLEPRVGLGRHLHPQPAGAPQQPGAPLRRLHRPQPGRRPGRRPGVPVAHLRGSAAGQPHLPGDRAFAGKGLPRGLPGLARRWPATWSASANTTRRRSSSPSSRPPAKDLYILQKRAMVHEQAKDAPVLRHLVAQTSALPPPWAWEWPAAPTPAEWRSTWSRSTGCWPRRPTRTSCCCGRTPSPKTSP